MSTTVYEFSGSSISAMEQTFPDVFSKEIYSGEFGVRGRTDGGSMTLEKGCTLPVPIYAVQSKITMTLRRGPTHVREGGEPFFILWVIEKGEVGISSASDIKLISGESVIILDSRATFFVEAFVDGEGEHRSLVALVPPSIFHASIRSDQPMNAVHFASGAPHGRVVAEIVSLLCRNGDILDEGVAASLLRNALDALGRLCESDHASAHIRRSVSEERVEQIKSCIALHFGDHAFGLTQAADICGISPRYVCSVLRKHGLSFADLLRTARLDLARSLLQSPDMRHAAIAQIARISGFRDGAELSRVFSSHCGATPREIRRQAQAADASAVSDTPHH